MTATDTSTPDIPLDEQPMTRRFKEGCWDLHQSAENGAFVKALFKGKIDREEFGTFLAQGSLVHGVLDDCIRAERDRVPALKALIDDEQFQADRLRADLDALGFASASIEPLPSTQRAIDLIRETAAKDPLMLLGLHYVREGANNGNRFIAKKLRNTFSIGDGEGLSSLDPYGDRQRAKWDAFKEMLDQQEFSKAQRDELVATARTMFQMIMDMHQDLESLARTN
ncbi:MAG: biliverdin-producing heme oxygenase [Planctomycetota bacterium]